MSINADGSFKIIYPFHDLEIGEDMLIPGDGVNIRSAASMWGRRYGIWLRVAKEGDAYRITRQADPIIRKRGLRPSRIFTLEQALREQKEALRAITLLILGIKNTLAEQAEQMG